MKAIQRYLDEHHHDLVLNLIHFVSPVGIIAQYRHRNTAFTDAVWFNIIPCGELVTVTVLKKVDQFTCEWTDEETEDDSSVKTVI
jgi:hypothetical protein